MNSPTSSARVAIKTTQTSTLRQNILRAAIIQALACSSGALYAANITVDSTADAVTNDGNCTLREAIEAANTDAAVDNCTAGAGADTISFDNTLSGSTVTLGGTELGISSDLTIDGDLDNDGNPDITIDANSASRVINVDASMAAKAVTLDGLTITGGDTTTGHGGGVRCDSSSYSCNMELSNSTVTGNKASSSGGGVYLYYGTLTITNSTISNNTAGMGGGVYAYQELILTNSTVSGNTASSFGGGLNCRDSNCSVTITDSTVSGNTSSRDGGGVFAEGNITLTNSTVSNNTATGSGGGMYARSGNITLTGSTVSGNSADGGGGMATRTSTGSVTIDSSTISGNTSSGDGGGVLTGNITLTNSTVSGNSAVYNGGGFRSIGDLSISNSTITANEAGRESAGVLTSARLTISGYTGGNISIVNSIIANNTFTGSTTLADCVGNNTTVNADAGNLVTDGGAGCGLSPVSTADPMLGAMADNGGPTQTHMPQAGSPVLDAGDNTNCPATDQRGANRDDGACDIGAVEGTVSLIPPSVIQFDAITATVNEDGGTVTISVTRSGNTSTAVSVDYATADDTAATPADYTGDMNALSFAAGETTQTITVTINDDTDVEGDETFTVTLSNAQLVSGSGSAELGANTSVTVTITDDDSAASGDSSTTTSNASSDDDGFLGIGALHPWWLLMGLAAWLRRGFRKA